MLTTRKLLTFAIITSCALFFSLIPLARANDVFVFNKNLQTGRVNIDVQELQKFLNSNGFVVNKSGVGSLGQETNFFGSATRNALIKFQTANNIIPAVGYFGPISRKAVNKFGELAMTELGRVSSQASDKSVSPTNSQPKQNINNNYYTISGSITGLAGAVVLQNNSQDELIIDIGQKSDFTFPTTVIDGAGYNVTVESKYANQKCYTNNSIGIVSGADIKNVKIACGANLSHNPFTYVPGGNSVTTYYLSYTAGEGGTISGLTSQAVNSGSNGSAVTAVPDTGYSFVSWSDGVVTATRTDSSVSANKTVSATFAINTYVVAFDANGSTGGTKPDNQTKTYGITLALASNSGSLVKTGYTFSGWNTAADGTGNTYIVGADYTNNAGVTLFAKWTINTYIITFASNGGDGGATAAQTLSYNTSTTLTINGFTRTSYTFAGWATTSSGAVAYVDGANYTIGTENVTLFAKWTPVLAVGGSYQGGKIAYIFQSGDSGYVSGQTHGLIAASADQSTSIFWHSTNSGSTGAIATAIGTGQANTTAILTLYGAENNAAKLCADYSSDVYSDWYLPSKDELNKLYLNRVLIGSFANNFYWSSSEITAGLSWYQWFFNGDSNTSDKNVLFYVRCIRTF